MTARSKFQVADMATGVMQLPTQGDRILPRAQRLDALVDMSKGWVRLRLRYMFVPLFLDVKFSGHLRPVNKAVTNLS